jgi:hypothetical protein
MSVRLGGVARLRSGAQPAPVSSVRSLSTATSELSTDGTIGGPAYGRSRDGGREAESARRECRPSGLRECRGSGTHIQEGRREEAVEDQGHRACDLPPRGPPTCGGRLVRVLLLDDRLAMAEGDRRVQPSDTAGVAHPRGDPVVRSLGRGLAKGRDGVGDPGVSDEGSSFDRLRDRCVPGACDAHVVMVATREVVPCDRMTPVLIASSGDVSWQ